MRQFMKKTTLLMAVGVMALAGCGVAGTVSERTGGSNGETAIETESQPETGTGAESQPETGTGAESQSETGTESQPGTESRPETGTESQPKTGTESQPEKDAEAVLESAAGAGADAESGALEERAAQGETNEDAGEEPVGAYEVKEPEDEQYTWQEITIMLPEDWVERCIVEESETRFSFYQKASYEMDDTQGYICGVFRTQEPVEYGAGMTLVAYTEEGTLYYLSQPMDVGCDTEDEKILGEYIRMCQQVPQLKASMQIDAVGVHGNADEYLLPTSSILELDQDMLEGFSDYILWIAKNEIYARHGRQFDNMYLQQYFDRCTWYEGEIPEQEFQESVLSRTERANLQLLDAAEQEYHRQHPYPQMYQASETALEDLNGDGAADEVGYAVIELGNGEYQCELTVNGETYVANGLSCPEQETVIMNPMMDCFYITDILEGDGFLEIAVLDEGPSDDPVTFFFRYDGMLSCIGQVPGFPFAEMNSGFNGFDGYGNISGCLQTDLIETAYVQGSWRYDGEWITHWDWGWYDYLPTFGHALYEDLPVHFEPEETSAVTVIPAQEEVFFLGTDMERWILVKGKDGSQGYMHVENGNIAELHKPAGEIFSGLMFSG